MAELKKSLKAAKAALDSQNFDGAVLEARKVLAEDSKNYFGSVFLGRGLEKQGKLDEASTAYEDATKSKPDEELAWKGLCQIYESQDSRKVSQYISAALGLAKVYMSRDDQDSCQTIIDKAVSFAKANGTRHEYKQALQLLLPSSPIFDFLEGRLQRPSYTYTKLAEISELEENELINRQIGERRTRLGASLGSVTTNVRREVFRNSAVESIYQNVIDWTNDDDERRAYEERLLQRAYDHLCVLLPEDKAEKRDQVIKLAHDMVVIRHPFPLAWRLELEWSDEDYLTRRDRGVLLEYVAFFPATGLSKALQGYLGFHYEGTKVEGDTENEQESNEESSQPRPLNTEDRLIFVADGLDIAKDSVLTYRLAASVYLQTEEYETAVETARKAQSLLNVEKAKSGLPLRNTADAINTDLATALIFYQSPKNHPEAQKLFNEILQRKPEATGPLLGVGLILEEQDRFGDAHDFLKRAAMREPENIRIESEAAWCKAMDGSLQSGLNDLQESFARLAPADPATKDLRALIAYRIGRCWWELYPDRKRRKDRQGPYSHFVNAIKLNPTFAPAFTSLGMYYESYAHDRNRARQCFQKAFELSASEVVAAEHLAHSFADDGEWDLVELVAQRVADSGQLRPGPGSKRKGVSWPFAALGVVHMNKQEYSRSVNYFQSALRITPGHYHSWVSLGESYHSSGRYNAARRTLEHALDLNAKSEAPYDDWFARYMLANVHRELGDYTEALSGYQGVLKQRPSEYGVAMAQLQTIVESSQHYFEVGLFAEAVEDARNALVIAEESKYELSQALNFWKAVADACMIFANVPAYADQFPSSAVQRVFQDSRISEQDPLESDRVTLNDLDHETPMVRIATGALLAYKVAITTSLRDVHAQAVAWYNLGWAEFKVSLLLENMPDVRARSSASRASKAAIRCFKRANELEAGNADFWNALGVVTTGLNPAVAQHSLVRSLYLNERSARTWTNLGTFYLLQNDHELAHEAFGRAQSTDPDYALAWLGEGLVALMFGDQDEASSHFSHAFEIADSSATIVERQYVIATFDHIVQSSIAAQDVSEVVRPLLALQKLQSQSLSPARTQHLMGLFQERSSDFDGALANISAASTMFEAQYESTESAEALGAFLISKADIARCQLAIGRYNEAVETCTTVLDLSSDQETTDLDADAWQKLRLSSHLVAGLANFYASETDEALSMFRSALEDSKEAADVICLLAQVLWARGSEQERTIAKEQLFGCVDKNEGHLDAMLLLGAMSIIEGDESTRHAVLDDMQAYRTSSKASPTQLGKLDKLISDPDSWEAINDDAEELISPESLTSVMLQPSSYRSWTTVTGQSDDECVSTMALACVEQSNRANHEVMPRDLASAYATNGGVPDVQRALLFDPSSRDIWTGFGSHVE